MHLDITEEEIKALAPDQKAGLVVGKYTIIGALPKVAGKSKKYIVKCSICAQDPYLFGLGVFTAQLNYINSGGNPCGCGTGFPYTEELQHKRAKRVIEDYGFKFNGFSEAFNGAKTRLTFECPDHGENSSTLQNLLSYNKPNCRGCFSEHMSILYSGTYDYNVNKFMSSGGFHEDTVFYRSDRRTPNGQMSYWFMICGECGEVGESKANHLNMGARSCACPYSRQKQAYINLVYNPNEAPIAIKFGIANSAAYRIKSQNSKSKYLIRQYEVYQFETKLACISAEREVKSKIEKSFLTKEEFPDGYTETAHIKSLFEIQRIYKKHGGVSIMHIANETYSDGCVAFVEATVFGIDHAKTSSAYFRSKDMVRENYGR